MAQQDDAYSKILAGAKIALPLTALLLMSGVFLIARSPEQTARLPYSDAELEALTSQTRINSPSFMTVSDDGVSLSLQATAAYLSDEEPTRAFVENLSLDIQNAEGLLVELGADRGWYDTQSKDSELTGDVHARTSHGYLIQTDHLDVRQEGAVIRALEPVLVQTPFGELNAGSMEMTRTESNGGHVLVFNDGVKLLYLPQVE